MGVDIGPLTSRTMTLQHLRYVLSASAYDLLKNAADISPVYVSFYSLFLSLTLYLIYPDLTVSFLDVIYSDVSFVKVIS